MAKAKKLANEIGNFILASVPPQEFAMLRPALQMIQVKPEEVIYRAREPIKYLYFPTSAMLSWIATTAEGERIEVGVVGWEGMVGIPELLGYEISPYGVEVELPGEMYCIDIKTFRHEFNRLNSLHGLLFRYTYTALTQLGQSSACGRFHTVEERLCRWLLMAHDRAETDELLLTQEILAGMIGARRPAVNLVTGTLQKAGLILSKRGRIKIVDRDGLEDSACECYHIIREAFDIFVGAKD